MNNCKNCLEPEIQPDGIIDLIDGLCDHCREKKEFAAILNLEYNSFDMEETMNLSERLALEWVAELLEKHPKEKVLELVEKRIEKIWEESCHK